VAAEDIRWLQRLENLERALTQLEAARAAHRRAPGEDLYVIALIKTFEIAFELAWKTLRDLLAYNGIDALLPREVLRQAFAADLLEDGQLWIDMLAQRNLMVHTYDPARAELAARLIEERFGPALQHLARQLRRRRESKG
jgi:nucleotidyltransferase substrate binding protein (TIGR01987 family)